MLLPSAPSVGQALSVVGGRAAEATPVLLLLAVFVAVNAGLLPGRRSWTLDDTAVSWSLSAQTGRPRRRGPPTLPV